MWSLGIVKAVLMTMLLVIIVPFAIVTVAAVVLFNVIDSIGGKHEKVQTNKKRVPSKRNKRRPNGQR